MISHTKTIGRKIADKLLKTTYTSSGFYYRVDLLKEFFEEVLFVVPRRNLTIREQISEFLKRRGENQTLIDSFLDILEEEYDAITKNTLYPTIEAAKKQMENIPTFILYVPREFTDEETDRIGQWVRRNIAPDLILSLRINPESVGGCMFFWRGVYHDFSFSHFFKKHTEKISSSIKKAYEH